MKEELLEKIRVLQVAVQELNETWNEMDWSIVPEEVSENYPFHQDLPSMSSSLDQWLKVIEKL